MAIAIPALYDVQLNLITSALRPKENVSTKTAAAGDLFVIGNRVADFLRLLTDLVDAGPLTATGGTATSVVDTGAYTGVGYLTGSVVIFQGNVTAALANVSAKVISNTVNDLIFNAGDLPAAPQAGDNYIIEFAIVDKYLSEVAGQKGYGSSQSNPYGYGPSLIGALNLLISQLGGTVPAWLQSEAFTVGSPHAGGSARGHGGSILMAEALTLARDTVAAYTKPV